MDYHVKRYKPDPERQISYFLLYVKSMSKKGHECKCATIWVGTSWEKRGLWSMTMFKVQCKVQSKID
jgi:hypothetical protein